MLRWGIKPLTSITRIHNFIVMQTLSPFLTVSREDYISENAVGFSIFDIFPVSEGHALVIPKKEVTSLFLLTQSEQSALWDLVSEIRDILSDQFYPAGFNIGINDGEAAGQTIAHAHVHIIPRYKGDTPDPRGGVRWILPVRAAYWSPPSTTQTKRK